MTKKDYIKIADIINENTTEDLSGHNKRLLDKDELIFSLCVMFEKDNPNFNWDKFIKYTK